MSLFSKTYTTAKFEFDGHQFDIENWYRILPPQSEMTFLIDGHIKGKTRKLSHLDPNEPVFQLFDFSEKINTIEVFVIGMTKIKFAVKINGEVVYQDNTTAADKWQEKVLGS